jgi:hypothetical protein
MCGFFQWARVTGSCRPRQQRVFSLHVSRALSHALFVLIPYTTTCMRGRCFYLHSTFCFFFVYKKKRVSLLFVAFTFHTLSSHSLSHVRAKTNTNHQHQCVCPQPSYLFPPQTIPPTTSFHLSVFHSLTFSTKKKSPQPKMVATTRTKTGKIPAKIEAAIAQPPPPAPKKRTTAANTSKPRDKKVASGRVAKPKAKTATKKTTSGGTVKAKTVRKEKAPVAKAKDKVEGKVEKAVGKVEGKPGKKVSAFVLCVRERGL